MKGKIWIAPICAMNVTDIYPEEIEQINELVSSSEIQIDFDTELFVQANIRTEEDGRFFVFIPVSIIKDKKDGDVIHLRLHNDYDWFDLLIDQSLSKMIKYSIFIDTMKILV